MRCLKFLAVLAAIVSASSASASALSCQMQSALVFVAAQARDQGKTQEQVRNALRRGGDVTSSEIKAVIDIVFVLSPHSSPKELADTVMTVCKR